MLLIFESHPVPYHAPVFRALQQDFDVPIHVIYGSDFSVTGYLDAEFDTHLSWDKSLLEGYSSQFLSRISEGGAANFSEVRPWGMTKAADAHPATAVLAVGYYAFYDLAAIGYAARRRLPLLFRGETNDASHRRGPILNLLRDFWLQKLYDRCSSMLYIGQRAKEHYQRFGAPEDKLIFSPYCVDERKFAFSPDQEGENRARIRQELGIPDDAIVVLSSGKLSKKKGVDMLSPAIRQLPEDLRRRVHLLLVGEGPLRDKVTEQCSAAPAIKTTLVGFQNQDALAAYYNAADVFVLASRERETWGVVINEALINGLPCVVSDRVGSQPDLVLPGVTGEVFPCGDITGLSQALHRLLPQLPNPVLSRQCRDRARLYSVNKAAEGIAKAWRKVSSDHTA